LVSSAEWEVVITHAGIQRIAEIFKLQMLEPKILIAPSQDNGNLIVIQIAIKEGDRVTWEIHESSNINTTSVSRTYPVRMAFKRAYDKAILSHLGLYDFSSDIESEDFSNGDTTPKYQSKREVPKSKSIIKPGRDNGNSKSNGEEDLTLATSQQKAMYFALLEELFPGEVEVKKENGKKWVRIKSGLPIESTNQIPKIWMTQLLNRLLAIKKERLSGVEDIPFSAEEEVIE